MFSKTEIGQELALARLGMHQFGTNSVITNVSTLGIHSDENPARQERDCTECPLSPSCQGDICQIANQR